MSNVLTPRELKGADNEVMRIERLRVAFNHQPAVIDASLSLRRGETLALVGESGSGKSVTALSLLQLLPSAAHVSGSITLEGRELVGLPRTALRALRGTEISMIFQNPLSALNPVLTIGEQIVETLLQHGSHDRTSARQRALQLIDMVHLKAPEKIFSAFPHNLSGGMRQRAMIAIAIACSPKVLIADEPTTALDVLTQAHILELLHELRDKLGMALLLITHDMSLVQRWADRVAVMRAGRIVEQNTRDALLSAPSHPYTRQLLAASARLHSESGTVPQRDAAAAPLLEVRDLEVLYSGSKHGAHRAVDAVSFDIHAGEVLGLVGESGSGKSTLSRAILSLVQPAAGKILYRGEDISALKGRALLDYRRRVQMVFQDPYASLNPRQTVAELIGLPLKVQGIGDQRERAQRIRSAMDSVRLADDLLRRYPHELSGGQRQRVGIARALVSQPELLICDEPLAALDVSIQAQILDLLATLRDELKLSYLFISHDIALVAGFADRMLVLREGRVIEADSSRQLWRHPTHEYSKQLIAASSPAANTHIARQDGFLQTARSKQVIS